MQLAAEERIISLPKLMQLAAEERIILHNLELAPDLAHPGKTQPGFGA